MNNVITWFDIPTADFERGIRFYEAVLGVTLHRQSMGSMQMAVFPCAGNAGVSGALVHMAGGQNPGGNGCVVYFNGGEDLDVPLARVEAAGGAVIVAKTLIRPEIGYFAIFRDSEGNNVGLHSPH